MAKRQKSTFERLQSSSPNRQQRKNLQRQFDAGSAELIVVHPNAAGIDVGNASQFVSVPPDRDEVPVREFGRWTADLRRMVGMVEILQDHHRSDAINPGVRIPIYDLLEQAGLEVYLVNARGTKNLPGRKSDVQERQWLR